VVHSLILAAGKSYDPPITITVLQSLRKCAPYKTKDTEDRLVDSIRRARKCPKQQKLST